MTNLTNWLSPTAMHSLAWALLHFLWQGAALAAVAAASMALCRRASLRYVVGVGALGLMVASPVATFLLLRQPASTNPATLSAPVAQAGPAVGELAEAPTPTRLYSSVFSPDRFPWLVELWLTGVVLLSLRTAGGFLVLKRRQRRQSSPACGRVLELCLSLQRHLGVKRAIRFCECSWLQAPAVVGWLRPVVFLPMTALTGLSEDQLRSVVAHEIAHIQRFDALVNVFQVCVETLLFYHPAVWWLNQRIRDEREHCCDDIAIARCGNPVEYARALTLMAEWRSAPALAMAVNRGPLSQRIARLLGLKPARNTSLRVGLSGSILCLAAALVAGNALLAIAHPVPIAPASGGSLRGLVLSAFPAGAQSSPAPRPAPSPAAKPSPAHTPRGAESATSTPSYIDALQAAGLKDLTPDDLIALKVQNVTPDYVRGLHELGLHPNTQGLVAMKVQGVSPEYVKDLRSLGFNPDESQIIALKVQGVSGDYVRHLIDAGIHGDADQIIALRVQGVTPAYVRDLAAAGLTVDADDVIALKVQRVTAEYMRGLHEQGLQPTVASTVGMRVQGVTPDYIRDLRALGLKPSAEQLIALKVQGVTPENVKALHSSGLRDFQDDPEPYIAAKVQGITPEFVMQAQKHGFKNLDLNKLIQLKQLGVLDTKGDI